jgi:hypothetical protein
MMPQLEKWVQDTARDRIARELDPIQSEYPAHTGSAIASGYCTPNIGTASLLLSVPSKTWFKPRTLWIDNEAVGNAHLMLYAGGSAADASASQGGIAVNGNATLFVALDCITTGNDLWVDATVASCHVRVGGILIASGPE